MIVNVLIGLGVLGLMVIVHEWGHFVAARYFGVRVVTFAVGFGPRLFGYKRGDTDFCVRAFPLGGYVKMAGDNFFEEREGAPDEFHSKPRWQRSIIALAGPLVNIVFAVLLLFVSYQVSYQKILFLSEPAEIYAVAPDSPAERAGMQSGDRIVVIGKAQNPTWEEALVETLLIGNAPVAVTVERDGEHLSFVVPPEGRPSTDNPTNIGWLPYSPIVITAVEPGMPAEQAGLLPGDEITALDEESTTKLGAQGFIEYLQEKGSAPVTLTVLRNGETFTMETQAEKRADGVDRYYLGIGIGPRMINTQLGPAEALKQSVEDNISFVQQLFMLLSRLVTGNASMGAVQGPIGIINMSGQAAQMGLPRLLELMTLISINLGVLNLLPIPILDGGHITLFAVEGLIRRDLSLQLKERFLQFGFLVMMLLFAVVMYNDIMRYFFR
jgi:regulator of sigma E protease